MKAEGCDAWDKTLCTILLKSFHIESHLFTLCHLLLKQMN